MTRSLLPFLGALAITAASADVSAAPRALGPNVHQSVDVGLDATRDAEPEKGAPLWVIDLKTSLAHAV